MKFSTLFLFAVLILGIAAYPNSFSSVSFDEPSLNTSLLIAFADEDDEGSDGDSDGDSSGGTDGEVMEYANDAIADAQEEINKAQKKIDESADEGKDTTLAQEQLDKAILKLEMAQASFDSGDFEEAEELADEAEDLASESRGKLIGKTEADLEDDGEEEEEEDEIELRGILTDNGNDTFDLDGTETISINDDTEIDDGLSLSDLVGLEVEVEAVEIDGVLFATEIELVEDEEEEEDEIKIKVEVEGDVAKVKVKFDGDKHRFLVTGDTSEDTIADAILIELPDLPLDKAGIMGIWKLEVEEEDEEESITLTTTEFDAYESHQESQELYNELLEQITELEDRIQALLEKYESGEYYGNVPEVDSEIMSYTISFTGFGVSQDDDSVSSMDGTIYIDSLITDSNTSKYTVVGGEISIDDIFYEFVFGKVRVTSSGNVMLIGQVVNWADENDDSSTIKHVIQSDVPLENGFGSESLNIEILPQSRIADQWYLSGLGILS